MTNKLRKHFPMIRDKEEIINEIYLKPELRNIYESWTDREQKEFIDFCTGVRGIKLRRERQSILNLPSANGLTLHVRFSTKI